MRLLLDENLPRKLVRLFTPEVEATTVKEQGWDGKRNGELLALAQREFDAFLIVDKGIEHQQNMEKIDLASIPLKAKSNSIDDIAPLVDVTKVSLLSLGPGTVVQVLRKGA